MGVTASHPHLRGQEVTTKAPLVKIDSQPAKTEDDLPDGPGAVRFPTAIPQPVQEHTQDAVIESDTQTERGGHYVLDGNVVLTYGNRSIRADHVEYDANTGELTATGHLLATGGANSERITASHGTANLKQ